MMYKLSPIQFQQTKPSSIIRTTDGAAIPFDEANTDYQAFKTAVLEQQANTVIEHDDSFSMSSDESILKDADGNLMTIDEAKAYVRTLP